LASQGSFDYLAVGKDDTAPFSAARGEARDLANAIAAAGAHNCQLLTGADQLGLLLLTRATNDRLFYIPFVRVSYAEGAGGQTVASYEDAPVRESVAGNLAAAGALPAASAENADLLLLVNTPADGVTREAMFAPQNRRPGGRRVKDFLGLASREAGQRPVALADIAFANGADNALIKELARRGLSYRLAAYAGWNTAGNSIGYAIGQGILASQTPPAARARLLTIRYLDDWAYQSNIRAELYRQFIWPRGLDDAALDNARPLLAGFTHARLLCLARKYRLPEQTLAGLEINFPWNRLFELSITLPETYPPA
jgi:hypothetical protein